MLEDWALRTILGLICVNLFIGGLYFTLRGVLIQYMLKNLWVKRTGELIRNERRFQAHVEWRVSGQSHWGVCPDLYTLTRKTKIGVYTTGDGHFRLDLWAYNGRGLILVGSLLFASALLTLWILL